MRHWRAARGTATGKALGKTTLALLRVDILVAQGYDAVTHTGPIGTHPLVPQIVNARGDVSFLVAGGGSTGRPVAAGLAMGASGVWIGPAWLLSKEHQAHMHSVNTEKLKAAESADTVITRSESGKTFR